MKFRSHANTQVILLTTGVEKVLLCTEKVAEGSQKLVERGRCMMYLASKSESF